MATGMTRGQRWTLRLFAVVALGTFLYGGLQLVGRQPARVQPLPDGSSIRIQAVQYGTNHSQINLERRWRFLAPFISERWAAKLGIMRGGISGSFPFSQFAVYTLREPHLGSMDISAVAVDSGGSGFECQQLVACILGTNAIQQSWLLPVFPRREKQFVFRLHCRTTNNSTSKAVEFSIRNPLRGPFPTWPPEPLPVTKTNGDVAVTLIELETGFRLPVTLHDDMWAEVTSCKVTLQVGKTIGTNDAWRVRSVELADATGNRWKPQGWRTNDCTVVSLRDGEVITLRGALPFDEPAWKVRVELSQTTNYPSRFVEFQVKPTWTGALPNKAGEANIR